MNASLKKFQKIKRKVNRAIADFSLFNRQERLLLALSGGKDSLALLWLLQNLNFRVEALHVHLGIKDFSYASLRVCQRHCRLANVPLHVVDAFEEKGLHVPSIPTQYEGKQCNICGTLKRQIFNAFALRNGFDVLLVAHNMDDEAAMLFANNKKWNYAYLKKSYPRLDAREGFVARAKPLVYCRENELRELAREQNYAAVEFACPHSEKGSRRHYNEIFSVISQKYPYYIEEYYKDFLKSYSQLAAINDEKIVLRPCAQCGELTSAVLCRLCSVKQKSWRGG